MPTFSFIPGGSRRLFLKNALVSLAGSALLPGSLSAKDTPAATPPERQLRIVQITDTHVIDEKSAVHTKRMLAHITGQEKPDMIFHTGDIIMDAVKSDKQGVADQWKCWKQIISGLNVPLRYCIGNHDVWWNSKFSGDPLYGKQWVLQELDLPGRYHSFGRNGWHFIFLDSTQQHGDGYTGGVDEEQMRWLTNELQQLPSATPVLISSHIPLLSAAIFDWSKCEEITWKVSGGLMHVDSHAVQALFRKHSNVKACISGHLHLQDHISYDQVLYMGCGAVSGNWWSAPVFHQTTAGYAVIDLFKGGEIKREYKVYNWEAAG